MSTTDIKPVVIEGKSYWACVRETNDLSNKYQLDIGNLDKATCVKLK